MEFIAIVVVPLLLLMAGAGILVVSQVSGFMQSSSLNQRQHFSNMIIQQYMVQIGMAQTQVFQRSRQLESLSSKLALSNQELGRLNEMKTKFLSMVVHDVRTPLASIRGFSELLMKREAGEREKQYLKNIMGSTDQLGRLIADLTDLAMIEAGKLKMEKAVFDFSYVARDILPGISINAQKRGVELVAHPLPEGLMINGDRFRLSQVLMNLLNNAVKFTPPGKRVELTMRAEGLGAAAYIKDAGIGIHMSEIKLIFEKFYQAKHQKDEKLRRQGWGLGLSIANEIIKGHKGEIAATSPGLGRGSTFYFRVPANSR
ncbi:MAG: HAMP domain-containing sensor histidine kinase [Elusimicrobiota bacterium]